MSRSNTQEEGIQRLSEESGAQDILKFPVKIELHVIADCKDHEVLIERGKESVIVKASEINALIAKLVKAKDIFGECSGR